MAKIKKQSRKKVKSYTKESIRTVSQNVSLKNNPTILIIGAFLIVGIAFGYGLGFLQSANEHKANQYSLSYNKSVLGTHDEKIYQNPFEQSNARNITFPIAQLKGCRNWKECTDYCSVAEHFPACIAWSKSIK